MKNLAIIAIIVGILAIGTVMALEFTEKENIPSDSSSESACPINDYNERGCTQDNSCGQPGCGIKTTGSCGCGK